MMDSLLKVAREMSARLSKTLMSKRDLRTRISESLQLMKL